jgi:hypothetical protein
MSATRKEEVGMSGDRHDVDSRIVLPAGMELVVPPAPSEPVEVPGAGAAGSGARDKGSRAAERVIFPPFVHRGELREAPAI